MPAISRFYGIVIKMFFIQHEHLPPHFHAIYGDHAGVYDINTMEMIEGDLPPDARRLVKKWAKKYQKDLLDIWKKQNFRELPWHD